MKKIYLCFIALTLVVGNNVFAQLPGFLDPIKEPAWDLSFTSDPLGKMMLKSGMLLQEEKINGVWVNNSKTTGIQDAQGNQLEFGNEEWDTASNSWAGRFSVKQSFTYNAQNKVTSRHAEMYSMGEPLYIATYTYTYDGSGKYLPVSSIDSANQGGNWFSFNTQDSIVYNAGGLISDRITSRSFMGISALTNKISFTYNSNGKITEAVLFNYENDAWGNDERHTYTYDANNNLTTHLDERFNDPNWETSQADSFYYTGSNITRKVSYFNGVGGLEPESYNEYTYTGSEVTEMIEKNWDGTQWVNEDKSVITYTGGKLTSGLIYKWVNNAWQTDAYRRIGVAPVGINNVAIETIGLYPNPTSSTITLSGNIALNTIVSIYNITGKLVKTDMLNNNTINVENLNNGIYFLTFENQGKLVRQKFVKN